MTAPADLLTALAHEDTTHRDDLGYRDDEPTMPRSRAGAASHVLTRYMHDDAEDDPAQALTHLLTDLRHLTDATGLDWTATLAAADDLHATDTA